MHRFRPRPATIRKQAMLARQLNAYATQAYHIVGCMATDGCSIETVASCVDARSQTVVSSEDVFQALLYFARLATSTHKHTHMISNVFS